MRGTGAKSPKREDFDANNAMVKGHCKVTFHLRYSALLSCLPINYPGVSRKTVFSVHTGCTSIFFAPPDHSRQPTLDGSDPLPSDFIHPEGF